MTKDTNKQQRGRERGVIGVYSASIMVCPSSLQAPAEPGMRCLHTVRAGRGVESAELMLVVSHQVDFRTIHLIRYLIN